MDAIRIEGLTKKYKDIVAVDNLNLSVHKGELFSLLGVNGAGKTTTIKMLSCLTQPTSGDAFLNGKSISKDTAAVKSLIAVSPQETEKKLNALLQKQLQKKSKMRKFQSLLTCSVLNLLVRKRQVNCLVAGKDD